MREQDALQPPAGAVARRAAACERKQQPAGKWMLNKKSKLLCFDSTFEMNCHFKTERRVFFDRKRNAMLV
jgi:hypothetical protein